MIKKCMLTVYDESIVEPPFLTIKIGEMSVDQPDVDDLGEIFAERLRVSCNALGYRFKFYSISEDKNYDYEVVVYP